MGSDAAWSRATTGLDKLIGWDPLPCAQTRPSGLVRHMGGGSPPLQYRLQPACDCRLAHPAREIHEYFVRTTQDDHPSWRRLETFQPVPDLVS